MKFLLTLATAFSLGAAIASAQEQYPKPLLHTAADHPAQHVLLISIDGLHAFDLADWIAAHPASALAELSARGVTYTNAHSPAANPAAGLMALVTGGTPISTGIVSGDGYDRTLSPPGSHCGTTGTALTLSAGFDPDGKLDASKLPLDPHKDCAPVAPHQLLRVNTMFEVVHDKIGPTAWAGSSAAAMDLLRGPSGGGLDAACYFASDEGRVTAVLHWIDGKDCAGSRNAAVPALLGLSLTEVAVAQRTNGTGYLDATATTSPGLAKRLAATDAAVGRIVRELKDRHLFDTTWIVVTAPYGQSPVDPRQRSAIPLSRLRAAAESVHPGLAHLSGGDAAMLWLKDPATTTAVVKTLSDQAAALGIQEIFSGAKLMLTLNSPARDPRTPDIVLQPRAGVLWGTDGDIAVAGYGGMLDQDTHVPMLISGRQLTGRTDPTPVPISQLAPMLLRSLGMEKFDLQALHLEHSPALPGIF